MNAANRRDRPPLQRGLDSLPPQRETGNLSFPNVQTLVLILVAGKVKHPVIRTGEKLKSQIARTPPTQPQSVRETQMSGLAR